MGLITYNQIIKSIFLLYIPLVIQGWVVISLELIITGDTLGVMSVYNIFKNLLLSIKVISDCLKHNTLSNMLFYIPVCRGSCFPDFFSLEENLLFWIVSHTHLDMSSI